MSGKTGKGGKIRGKRYRLHAAAPKPEETVFEVEEIPQLHFQKNVSFKSNIFKNVIITPDALKQKLPSYSKKDESNLAVKSVIKDHAKKGRKKIPFHEVVASAKDFLKKREKEKKERKATILGNFQALEEALPVLDQLIEKNKKDNKPRASKCFSKQEAEMMEDLQTYQQVLNDTEYSTDPFGTIADQLRKRLQSGCL